MHSNSTPRPRTPRRRGPSSRARAWRPFAPPGVGNRARRGTGSTRNTVRVSPRSPPTRAWRREARGNRTRPRAPGTAREPPPAPPTERPKTIPGIPIPTATQPPSVERALARRRRRRRAVRVSAPPRRLRFSRRRVSRRRRRRPRRRGAREGTAPGGEAPTGAVPGVSAREETRARRPRAGVTRESSPRAPPTPRVYASPRRRARRAARTRAARTRAPTRATATNPREPRTPPTTRTRRARRRLRPPARWYAYRNPPGVSSRRTRGGARRRVRRVVRGRGGRA